MKLVLQLWCGFQAGTHRCRPAPAPAQRPRGTGSACPAAPATPAVPTAPARPKQNQHRSRPSLFAALLTLTLGLSSQPAGAQITGVSEYDVKAAWLVNFARFVDWPTNSFPEAHSPIQVGVLGKDLFGKEMEQAFHGKIIHGRSLVLKPVSSDQDLRSCHILFVSSSERRRLRDLPERLKGASVLTVGESEDFLDHGGVINFVLQERAVRFEININTAQAARLKLDANLLRVAVSVRGRYD